MAVEAEDEAEGGWSEEVPLARDMEEAGAGAAVPFVRDGWEGVVPVVPSADDGALGIVPRCPVGVLPDAGVACASILIVGYGFVDMTERDGREIGMCMWFSFT